MKIFKKLKRFFGIDEKEYEYEQYYEEDIEIDYEEENTQVGRGTMPRLDPQQARTTFRFPLIEDEEMREHAPPEMHKKQPRKSAVFYDEQESTSVKLPSHLHHKSSLVYDVEVSGISELLAKRNKTHGKQSIVRFENTSLRTRPKSTITSVERQFLTSNPSREDTKETTVNPDIQPKFGKRFVPSDVPSPVYGFRKPKSIEELVPDLEEKQEAAKKNVENEQKLIVNEENVSVEEQQQGERPSKGFDKGISKQLLEENDHLINEQLLEEDTNENLLNEHISLKEEEHSSKEEEHSSKEEEHSSKEDEHSSPFKDMSVQHLTIENSTVHIEQLHVEPQKSLIVNNLREASEETSIEEKDERVNIELMEESQQEEKEATSGSKLPFNVIMLASDKAKLKNTESQFVHTSTDMLIDEQAATILQAPSNSVKLVTEENNIQEHLEEDVVESKMEEKEEELRDGEGPFTEQLHPFEDVNRLLQRAITDEEEMHAEQPKDDEFNLVDEGNDKFETPSLHEPIENKENGVLELDHQLNRVAVEDESNNGDVVKEAEPSVTMTPMNEAQQEHSTSAHQSIITESLHEEIEKPVLDQEPIHIYEKPSIEFLLPAEERTEDWAWLDEQANYLIEALASHQVHAQIESIEQGPAVTQFEITVAQGTKVSKVRNLSDDIKLALAAKDIRIDAPIPGKRTIGIEIPNRVARAVRLSEVTNSERFQQSDSPLEAALGLDLSGKPVTIDLRKMPHGLIAGATGSGKSVCINSILVSLLYKADPHELKLMLIDPKMVELAPFNRIPHLVSPVITDVKAATAALKWAVDEMERRYQLFMHAGVRDITRFNQQAEKAGQHAQKMPYILIVIDELADLMMMSPADVEEAICRIAQKARACGIHLIVATQRPSVDVITGLIKSNIPTRIAFAVSSAVDSRTILDMHGAERLLGRGDMLYLGNGMPAPIRLQGTFVTDDEIEEIIDYVRSQGEPNYLFAHEDLLKKAEIAEEHDELFEEVCRYVYELGTASTSSIQRRYHIGYNRAARLVEMLEKKGFVSEQRGSKPREVFINESDLDRLFN